MNKIVTVVVIWLIGLASLGLGVWGLATAQRRSLRAIIAGIVIIFVASWYARYYNRLREEATHWFDRSLVRWFVLWTVVPALSSLIYLTLWHQWREQAYTAYSTASKAEQGALYAKYMAINGEMLWTNIFLFVVPIFVMGVFIRLTILVLSTHVSERMRR